MDEYNLHYYIARWDKSDPGGLEFLKRGYLGSKNGLELGCNIGASIFMTIDYFYFI